MKLLLASFAFAFAAFAVDAFVLSNSLYKHDRPGHSPPFIGTWDNLHPYGLEEHGHKNGRKGVPFVVESGPPGHDISAPKRDHEIQVEDPEAEDSEEDYELKDDKPTHKSLDFMPKHMKPKSCKKYKKKCEKKGKKKSCKKYQKCCKKTRSCISQHHEYFPVTLPRHPLTFPTAPIHVNTKGPVVEVTPTEEYEYDEEESASKRDHVIPVEDPADEILVQEPEEEDNGGEDY